MTMTNGERDAARYTTADEGYPYASRRFPVLASRGVVSTTEPLAAQAGLSILRGGGNAVDAAIATAIALTVLEPTSNGIGGDAFALIWDGKTLHGLNGSGRAPATHTPDLFDRLGLDAVPTRGWLPVTVPGAPALWRDLHARFGKAPFADLCAPAIAYAEEGFPPGPVTRGRWERAAGIYGGGRGGAEFEGWFETFAPNGQGPRPGAVVRLPGHGATLRAIAASKADDFYHGDLAGRIADFASATGGYLTRADLAAHESTWVDPISTSYRGYDVWELPPNGQGVAALGALNILEGFDLTASPRESVESYHLQIESMKLAFADALRYVADPTRADVPTSGLLDKTYAAARRRLIGDKALDPAPGSPPRGGTVYLCAADGEGMMVSLIQSNYMGFGSGIVVPGAGIALQNRGANFTLDPTHPNVVAPGKRPYHTIIPAFLTHEGRALGPFGVMGGYMQPQGHLQVVVNDVDYGMNVQSCLDAPRWQWVSGKTVIVEPGVPEDVRAGLVERGHEVVVEKDRGVFGSGQIIRRLESGAYAAASEPRADGYPAAY